VHGLRGHPRHTWEEKVEAVKDEDIPTDVATRSRQKERFTSFFKRKSTASASNNKTSEEPHTKVFWPNDYLTEDIPEARIWTYGYDADVIGGLFAANNQNTVWQHGQDLKVRVEREIDNEVGQSPSSVLWLR